MSVTREWSHIRIEMARIIAKRSLCSRDQVGAIITDVHNRIIGEGYNGPPARFDHQDLQCTSWCKRAARHAKGGLILPGELAEDYSDCPSLHAEANALMMSDRTQRLGGSIYVTSFPCVQCLKLISNSGLTSIFIGVDGAHEYRYRESDYETVRKLGFRIEFEDQRMFSTMLRYADGWIAEDGSMWSTRNAQNWCAPSPAHVKDNGVCVHGCDPNSTNCD